MSKIINIRYDSKAKSAVISSDDIYFDAERLNGIEISKWIYPFHVNGVKWYGLYDELVNVYQHKTFTLVFDGDSADFETLKKGLAEHPVELKEKYSKVIILYDEVQYSTKITINGKVFDTQRIDKRSIDEWVKPFSFKAADWQGIFGEIENYLGSDCYTISFVGKPEDMKILMDNAPYNISIFYKPPVAPKKKPQPLAAASGNLQADPSRAPGQGSGMSVPQFSKPDLNSIKGSASGLIGQAKAELEIMKQNESGIFTFGMIAVILAAVCCVIFTIFMSRFLMILSTIPAIVFCVLAFVKGYKKLAICTFAAVLIMAVISYIIVTIRWRIAFSGFEDIADDMDEVNSAMDEVNDALAGMN